MYKVDPQILARINDAQFFGCLDEVMELLGTGCTLEDLDMVLEKAEMEFVETLGGEK